MVSIKKTFIPNLYKTMFLYLITNYNYIIMKAKLFIYFLCFILISCKYDSVPGNNIRRMGSSSAQIFNDGWLFKRYGFQSDGNRVDEPKGLESVNWNDSKWEKLSLPHDWAIKGPFRIELAGETGKLPYKAIGWYRKHFKLNPEDINKRIYIDFDGAMAYTKVWLNGHYVGTWPYGYNSFRFDLTPYIKFDGDNVLAVRLDTENFDARWYSGGGIYRNVWLVKNDPIHIAHWGTFVTTPEISKEKALVNINMEIENHTSRNINALIRTNIYKFDNQDCIGKNVATFDDVPIYKIPPTQKAKAVIKGIIKEPQLWDVCSPNRYIVINELIVDGKVKDTYYTSFGIRSIKFTPKDGFQLNGRRVDIKGVCMHHDLGALGSAFNLSALKRQFEILQEMGCNAIRCAHNPPAVEFLDLADKMGFLVCDELYDTWEKGKREKDFHLIFNEWHEKDLQAMIRRDRNHPSVILWSIGNEVIEQRNYFITKHLTDIAHKEDSTRSVTACYNDPTGGYESGAATAVDVMGLNYYFEQESKWKSDNRYINQPSIGTETVSAVSSRGIYLFDFERDDTINWQVSSYDYRGWDLRVSGWQNPPDAQFYTNARFPHLAGEFVWTGFDYLGEPTPYNSDETNLLNYRNNPEKKAELAKKIEEIKEQNPPSRSSYFGIVDLAGFPKDRYYLYQSHWRPEKPMVHILPHWNWPERIGGKVPVHVYTSGDEAELFINGKSQGRKKKETNKDFRLMWNDVIYEPGIIKVIAYKDGNKWAEKEIKTTGDAYSISLETDKNIVISNGDDLIFITARIQDSEGLTVPKANNNIKFSIDGPGEVIATDNGDATSFESFQSSKRKAFNGLALAIIKPHKGVNGIIKVIAESQGLKNGYVSIIVKK